MTDRGAAGGPSGTEEVGKGGGESDGSAWGSGSGSGSGAGFGSGPSKGKVVPGSKRLAEVDVAEIAAKRHKFDDTRFLEQSREINEGVRSAVSAGTSITVLDCFS